MKLHKLFLIWALYLLSKAFALPHVGNRQLYRQLVSYHGEQEKGLNVDLERSVSDQAIQISKDQDCFSLPERYTPPRLSLKAIKRMDVTKLNKKRSIIFSQFIALVFTCSSFFFSSIQMMVSSSLEDLARHFSNPKGLTIIHTSLSNKKRTANFLFLLFIILYPQNRDTWHFQN